MDFTKLPIFSVATLLVFYLIAAAMHDIAHGESDLTFEYCALVVCAVALTLLYRAALKLPERQRSLWLAGTGLLVLLFVSGAVNVFLRPVPMYRADPALAAGVLLTGIPLLISITLRLLDTRPWGWLWGHRKRPFDGTQH